MAIDQKKALVEERVVAKTNLAKALKAVKETRPNLEEIFGSLTH